MNPTIMIDGKDMTGDVESCSRASSKSRIYTPGAPLTPTQVRRMSTLSTLSVTVQDFTVRPVSPGIATGSNDPLSEQGKDIFIECGRPESENNLSISQFTSSYQLLFR